jgi:hypothetical protein
VTAHEGSIAGVADDHLTAVPVVARANQDAARLVQFAPRQMGCSVSKWLLTVSKWMLLVSKCVPQSQGKGFHFRAQIDPRKLTIGERVQLLCPHCPTTS